MGSTGFCVFIFLKNKNCTAFSHDKTFTLFVERTAGLCRIICIRMRQCLQNFKTRNRITINRTFSTTAQTDIYTTAADQIHSVPESVTSARTGCSQCMRQAVNTKAHTDISCCFVRNKFRNRQRWYTLILRLIIFYTAVFCNFKASDTDAEKHGSPVKDFLIIGKMRIIQCHFCSGNGIFCKMRHLAPFFRIHIF